MDWTDALCRQSPESRMIEGCFYLNAGRARPLQKNGPAAQAQAGVQDGSNSAKLETPSSRTGSKAGRLRAKRENLVLTEEGELAVALAVEREVPTFMPEADRPRMTAAFRTFADSGSIFRSSLVEALKHMGFWQPKQEWVDEIMAEVSNGAEALDMNDFFKFTEAYFERFNRLLQARFKQVDVDGSGSITAAELTKELREMGFSPVPGMVRDLMREVTGVDNCAAPIRFEHFVQLHGILDNRAGFTLAESEHLHAVFKRFDIGGIGVLNTKELRTALSWTCFGFDPPFISSLLGEADANHSSGVSQAAFLRLMRRLREREVEMIGAAFAHADSVMKGSITAKQLSVAFSALGCAAELPEIINELREDCGFQRKTSFLCEDLYSLLDQFQKNDGFLHSELEEIESAFKLYDVNDFDGLGGVDLLGAVRWLGYPMTLYQLQDAFEEFDMEGSGELSSTEFRKLIKKFHPEETTAIQRLLASDSHKESETATVSDLHVLLLQLGYVAPKDEVTKMVDRAHGPGARLGKWDLRRLVTCYRQEAKAQIREHLAFSEADVRRLRRQFGKHDPAGAGFIADKNLTCLLQELFPGMQTCQSMHNRCRAMLKRIDNGTGAGFDFKAYLRLMRLLQDEADSNALDSQDEAIKECGYTYAEVRELRNIYKIHDTDNSGDISFAEFKTMVSTVFKLDGNDLQTLTTLLEEIDNDKNQVLDFAEFLRMMHKVQTHSWGNR